MHVLIDTWWNVNVDHRMLAVHSLLVLIDTWWNVNDTQDDWHLIEYAF